MFRRDELILETVTRGEWCEPGAVLNGYVVTRIKQAKATNVLQGGQYPCWLIYGKPIRP